MLHDLLTVGNQGTIQFAFVSACYSENTAQAFLRAGVPHVVAVQWNQVISDKAAIAFSKHFYAALFAGRSIANAFTIGTTAVKMDASILDETEAEKFLLLPCDESHDTVLFPVLEDGPWECINQSRIPPYNRSPRDHIIRSDVMYDLGRLIAQKQFVQVTGPAGVGKSCLVHSTVTRLSARGILKHVYTVSVDQCGILHGQSVGL